MDPVRKVPMPLHIFNDRYCVIRNTPWGNKIVGSKNLDDLKRRIDHFMLRRRKKDVLHDLPPFDFQLYPLDTINLTPQQRADLDIMDSRWEQAVAGADADDLQALAASGKISTERRLLGEFKAPLAYELAKEELDADHAEKIILFCHHLTVIDTLMALFRSGGYVAVRCDGRMSSSHQADAVERFQTDPKVRVFIGQTVAAGTSVTLHASSNVIVVEPSFVPKDNVQAAARAHRFGQKKPVLARYLYLDDTLDEKIMSILLRKIREIAIVLDDEPENLGAPV